MMMDKVDIRRWKAFEKRIGYRFKERQLLLTALTHPSFRYEDRGTEQDNQRLEFLGDAVLGLLSSDWLMARFPEAGEGELTERKAALISGLALAAAARRIGIGEHVRLGRGEAQAGGADRDSILEDALEALLGAVWLDGGLKAARRFFERHLIPEGVLDVVFQTEQNPKGMLQEVVQKRGEAKPEYSVVEQSGPDHARRYTVQVEVSGRTFRGEGTSRREAEKEAAAAALDQVGG